MNPSHAMARYLPIGTGLTHGFDLSLPNLFRDISRLAKISKIDVSATRVRPAQMIASTTMREADAGSNIVADAIQAAESEIDGLVASCASDEERFLVLQHRIEQNQRLVDSWMQRALQLELKL